jgi:nucleolar GTP-binding protein
VILDIAFRRAYRATPHGADRHDRSRRRALLKIVRSTSVVQRHLRLEMREFKEPLTDLQLELVEQRFPKGAFPRALARVRRAEERIRRLAVEEQRELRRAGTEEQYGEVVRSCYGRMASFLKEVDGDLRTLRDVVEFLGGRPRLDTNVPTVVVAGFPNVGKSSLVARLSSARPEIADYPFTTLAISVGHADLGFDRMQVVDTPGVLGRTGRMNPAEAEATSTVARAADVVLFVLDPSERCGYTRAEQEALLARWHAEFPSTPFLEVETKADLPHAATERLQVSATTGLGLEELGRRLRQMLAALPPRPAPEPDPEPTGPSAA